MKKTIRAVLLSFLAVGLALSLVCATAFVPGEAAALERIAGSSKDAASISPAAGWTVTPTNDTAILINSFLGSGVTPSNVVFTGTATSAGLFTTTSNIIGFESGIILSSGHVNNVVGPNTQDGITAVNNTPGDANLNSLIPGYTTYDATVLEFDFTVPAYTGLTFQYVFASDEYNEYVHSQYNDVFGFFLDGANIALIPGTSTPVSINNVNNGNPYGTNPVNPEYYNNNDLNDGGGLINTEMDGFTVVLAATAQVLPGDHHMKLAVADAGDFNLDSNVFLKAESFVINGPPVISADNSSVTVDEGTLATNTGPWSDPNGDLVTLTASVGDVTRNDDGTWSWSYQTADGPIQTQTVTITADDGNGGVASTTFELTVNNVPPVVGAITVNPALVSVGTSVNAGASFTDAGTLDTHTATWDWGDSATSAGIVTETNGSGTVDGSYEYTTPGVYTIELTVVDKDGGSGESIYQYVVVYDPSAGFVTGGGWINSPEGAYPEDLALTGKATFGFVSKYQKGATVPTGQTEFHFQVADLNFHSSSYDWLVIAGARAQYKGTGTINGMGEYGFMLTAIDGQISGGGLDKFRIKIWNKADNTIVYDNQLGASDTDNPVTALGGGSIVIHKK
jgi:hypothetical protein